MAVCLKLQTVWVPISNVSTPLYQMSMLVPDATDPANCLYTVGLSSTEYKEFIASQSNFGWSTDGFELALGAALLMFATGFGIGLVVQLIRRLRTP